MQLQLQSNAYMHFLESIIALSLLYLQCDHLSDKADFTDR
jgi:hypothetical protein